jgi:hypothetical protein
MVSCVAGTTDEMSDPIGQATHEEPVEDLVWTARLKACGILMLHVFSPPSMMRAQQT